MGAVVLLPDASMGVSPTEAVPLSQPETQASLVPMSAALGPAPSRFAVWRSLESRADSLASLGALAFAVLAVVAYAVL